MRRVPQERREAILSKLLPPHNKPVPEVAIAEGVGESTLYNWLSQARKQGIAVPGSRSTSTEHWNAETKLAAVIETQPMNESELAEYCRKKGLYPEQIERWKKECLQGMGSTSDHEDNLRQARNEIKQLKRKVERKDKALAESAALLVLSKKFQALWEDEEK
jgi:transposase-like protein